MERNSILKDTLNKRLFFKHSFMHYIRTMVGMLLRIFLLAFIAVYGFYFIARGILGVSDVFGYLNTSGNVTYSYYKSILSSLAIIVLFLRFIQLCISFYKNGDGSFFLFIYHALKVAGFIALITLLNIIDTTNGAMVTIGNSMSGVLISDLEKYVDIIFTVLYNILDVFFLTVIVISVVCCIAVFIITIKSKNDLNTQRFSFNELKRDFINKLQPFKNETTIVVKEESADIHRAIAEAFMTCGALSICVNEIGKVIYLITTSNGLNLAYGNYIDGTTLFTLKTFLPEKVLNKVVNRPRFYENISGTRFVSASGTSFIVITLISNIKNLMLCIVNNIIGKLRCFVKHVN